VVIPERVNIMLRDDTFTEWRKSSFSSGGDNCVEIGFADDGRVAVRDTEMDGRGPLLVFSASEWEAFTGGVRQGEFDTI
jgi:Domain of unknown function (DUF397)